MVVAFEQASVADCVSRLVDHEVFTEISSGRCHCLADYRDSSARPSDFPQVNGDEMKPHLPPILLCIDKLFSY